MMMDLFRFLLTSDKLCNDKHTVNTEGLFLDFLEKTFTFTKTNRCFMPIVMIQKWVVLLFKTDFYFSQLKCNDIC